MAVRKLGPNEKCGCGSGAKYKRCCLRAGTAWFVDERGTVIDAGVAGLIDSVRLSIGAIHEREHGRPMRTFEEAQIVYASMSKTDKLDYLMGVQMPPDMIYAFEKTDILVPHRWWAFFRRTNVIPLLQDRSPCVYAAGLHAIVEYDRIAGGESVPDPEYLTIQEIIDQAKLHDSEKHRQTMDKRGRVHIMQRTGCRGCLLMGGLLDLSVDRGFMDRDRDSLGDLVTMLVTQILADGVLRLEGIDVDDEADRD